MRLILIRHAVAEDRRLDLEDRERHLTEEGKEEFRALMPELKEKLAYLNDPPYYLWSSPSYRTMETAQIVAETLGIEVIDENEFIYSGDYLNFSDAIAQAQEEAIFILVGHEPTLSDWSGMMAHKPKKFKKSEIRAYIVDGFNPLTATFKWRIKP